MRRFLPFAALVGLGLVRATGQDLYVGSNTPNNTLEITNGLTNWQTVHTVVTNLPVSLQAFYRMDTVLTKGAPPSG